MELVDLAVGTRLNASSILLRFIGTGTINVQNALDE